MSDNLPMKADEAAVKRLGEVCPVMDFSTGAQLMSVEQQEILLEERDRRRQFFIKWVFAKLQRGVHYGDVAKGTVVDNPEYRYRPDLYKAGALYLCDLLDLKPAFETDFGAWEMAGKPQGIFFRKCTLHTTSGIKCGEGAGAYAVKDVGVRKNRENAALKLGDKSALVAAVLNGVPYLSDLFHQDSRDVKGRLTLAERRQALVQHVQEQLVERKSKWGDSVEAWIKTAWASFSGSETKKMNTPGAVDAFEKALEEGKIDWNTGKVA